MSQPPTQPSSSSPTSNTAPDATVCNNFVGAEYAQKACDTCSNCRKRRSDHFRQRDGDQPLPKAGDVDVIEHSTSAVALYASARGWGGIGASIVIDLEKRAALGVVRYGKRLQTNNGRDARLDQYEELLDALNYGQQVCLENPSDYTAAAIQEGLMSLVISAKRGLEQA